MINQDKSAQTRFNNDRTMAAKRSVSGNPAAANALRLQGQNNHTSPKGAPVTSGPNEIVDRDVSQLIPQGFKPMNKAPQGPPQGSEGPSPSSNPIVDRLVQEVHLEKLITSPELQGALTKVRLRDHFNNRDSGPDTGRQVLEILDTYK